MATTIVATAIGFCTTLSSFDDSGDGGDPEARKKIKETTTVTCDDISANIQFSQGTDGKIGIGAQLGPLGTWNANISGTGVHSGSGTINNFMITYPKNADGTKKSFTKTSCLPDGDVPCTTTSPCLQMAIDEIKSAF